MLTTTFLSPSCQQIVSQDLSSLSKTNVLVRSCTSHPALQPTITNHRCNGVALTPAGLYIDMALTVAEYIWKQHHGSDDQRPGFNVHDLAVHKPVVVRDPSKMDDIWLEMETTMTSSEIAHCVFYSIDPVGVRLQKSGHCFVRFESSSAWLSEWANHTAVIQNRVDKLYTRSIKETAGYVRLVQRATAYELFQSFVDYGGRYQNMSEVVYDTQTLEATALLSFFPDPEVEALPGPYYLDGSCHLSGFLCNAVEKDTDRNAYISHGVKSMRLSPRFRPQDQGAKIITYVRMEVPAKEKSVLQGSVFVLQDGEIVGLWAGVGFKRIPRKALNVFLPPPKR